MTMRLNNLLSAALVCAAVSPFVCTGAQAAPPVPVAVEVTTTADDNVSLWDGVGAYNQPQWVKSRRYATTRVHIQRDPWEVAVEQWARGRLNGGNWSFR